MLTLLKTDSTDPAFIELVKIKGGSLYLKIIKTKSSLTGLLFKTNKQQKF